MLEPSESDHQPDSDNFSDNLSENFSSNLSDSFECRRKDKVIRKSMFFKPNGNFDNKYKSGSDEISELKRADFSEKNDMSKFLIN
jgi:hypothetical protein